ncbi:MAG TPA: DUF4845 domain-containing protein [Candidatus Saccharimonadia bacterium]|nr:DUF4845 domain-containing protein [Candidatus Saccharimonadia bacterium]
MTLLGFVIVLVIVAFFGLIGMKLFPVYSEYYGVRKSLSALQQEPGVAQKTPDQIRSSLQRKWFISYVKTPTVQKNVKISKKGGQYLVTVAYERRGNLLYNLDYIAVFDKTVSLTRQGGD